MLIIIAMDTMPCSDFLHIATGFTSGLVQAASSENTLGFALIYL